MSVFVLELGFEELPASFLPGLEKQLAELMAESLLESKLTYSLLETGSSPRRAFIIANNLPKNQPASEEEVFGPPLRIAYGPDGSMTKAGLGFIKNLGISQDSLYSINTQKGDYLAARVKKGGESTLNVLSKLCPEIIRKLSFQKQMRWGSYDIRFARPLRWILALLDESVISFDFGSLISGRNTFGHREHGPGPFSVNTAGEYLNVISKQGCVIAIATDRRADILKGGDSLAQEVGGKVIWDDDLLEEVTGLVEHPVPILGSIDKKYLNLPREVLLTSMQKHQKSFGLEGEDGKLLPYFLTVLNITSQDADLTRHGWERVLRARLEDASFFFSSDLKVSLDNWINKLDRVTFLAPLGTMGDKGRRLAKLCRWIGEVGIFDREKIDPSLAERAGKIAKADLVSGMVGEFDNLQGIMGGIYASLKGEREEVVRALAEQYLPAGANSPLPETAYGAILSLADKADSLAGCFGLGMIPTGVADPYALRRAALGIARIMLGMPFHLDVKEFFAKAIELYGERVWKLSHAEHLEKLLEFFSNRVRNMFLGAGEDSLFVEAICNVDALDVWAAQKRLQALKNMSLSPDFTANVLTFKRVANIVHKQDKHTVKFQAGLLQEEAEKILAEAVTDFKKNFAALETERNYEAQFALLSDLRPAVDEFFAKVMVMDEDINLRNNRLALLDDFLVPLSRLADFSALKI